MKMKGKYFIVLLLFGLLLFACKDSGGDSNNDTGYFPTVLGSWTKTGGHILTFYNSGAVTSNNLGTGTYGNGVINLSVPMGNSGTGSYILSGTKLIISDFPRVGATNFDQLNGEWLKME